MRSHTLTFVANDDARLTFPCPGGVNFHLVIQAVDKIASGADEDAATFGLTLREQTLVAEVVAKLEEHAKAKAVA